MNEPAIRLEEQIISLFPHRETQVLKGWILKKMGGRLWVYPLYYKFSKETILDNIQKCEEISRQSKTECVFRLVEHTNYYLSSLLTDCGYGLKTWGVVGKWSLTGNTEKFPTERKFKSRLTLKHGTGEDGEYVMAGADTVIGIRRQKLFFLPDGNLPAADIEDVLQFSLENGVTQILADLPGQRELPESYEHMGFCKAYLYSCYTLPDEVRLPRRGMYYGT